ncbi:ferritin family protein [Desulfococcus sp.]|uniref:ferritin family protein n=1 Tax=Desulfococcus sp. TaxID=2025834 RepID=UPI0035943E20
MTPDEAIRTAITYETKIRDLYRDAAASTRDPTGKRVFGLLAEDEQRHLDYLHHKLEEWDRAGVIRIDDVKSVVPPAQAIRDGMAALRQTMAREDRTDEKRMLAKALAVEIETSRFYEKMVEEMADDTRPMFARFLESEHGHIEIVQAELDYISRTGYWFDIKEFDME